MPTINEIMSQHLDNDPQHQAQRQRSKELNAVFGPVVHPAVPILEDAPCYPSAPLARMFLLWEGVRHSPREAWEPLIAEFIQLRDSVKKNPDCPQRIYLWPQGKVPTETHYTDNSDYRYNHDPDFAPYLFALPVSPDVTPKGAVLVCAGGDHGYGTLTEGYQTCLDFNAMGYQAFLLNNRPNHNPWSERECGVDAARALRIIRRDAAKYRIDPRHVAFAGFSNGGVTGECCILNYSGDKKVSDIFPDYVPDELDDYYGAPDVFLCVYGPRFAGATVDYTGVVYPPTFFAVGREDSAMDNLNATLPDLLAHGVEVEVHTFAGVPHGMAGRRLADGRVDYPNFELWLPLADAFMQDVYRKQKA